MSPRNVLSKIMKGWHASPHDFDEFRHDPGTARSGAGNAAYGEGIYAARDYDEMDEYYKWFKGKNNDADELYDIVYDIQRDNPRGYGNPTDQAFVMERLRASQNPNLRALADNPDAIPALMTIVDDQGSPKNAYAVSQATQRLKNHLQSTEPKVHRYELEIGAPENQFLDWTERLTDQSDDVRTIMSDLLKPDLERMQEGRNAILKKGGTGSPGSRWFKPLSPETQAEYASGSPNPTGENMYRILQKRKNPMEDTPESAQYASDTLRDAGIPGNLHPDAQNNPRRNVAVFDPKILKIIKKYGIPGALGLGLISQSDADAYAAEMMAQEESYDPKAKPPPSQNVDVKGFGSLTQPDDSLRGKLAGVAPKLFSAGSSGEKAATDPRLMYNGGSLAWGGPATVPNAVGGAPTPNPEIAFNNKRSIRYGMGVPRKPQEPAGMFSGTGMKYLGQSVGRGSANAFAGASDAINSPINDAVTDADFFSGGKFSGGTYNAPQLPLFSDSIKQKAADWTGADIVKDEDVSFPTQLAGTGADFLISLFADPSNYVPGVVGAKMAKPQSSMQRLKKLIASRQGGT